MSRKSLYPGTVCTRWLPSAYVGPCAIPARVVIRRKGSHEELAIRPNPLTFIRGHRGSSEAEGPRAHDRSTAAHTHRTSNSSAVQHHQGPLNASVVNAGPARVGVQTDRRTQESEGRVPSKLSKSEEKVLDAFRSADKSMTEIFKALLKGVSNDVKECIETFAAALKPLNKGSSKSHVFASEAYNARLQSRLQQMPQGNLQAVGAAAAKFPGKASDPVVASIDLAAQTELRRRLDVLKSADAPMNDVLVALASKGVGEIADGVEQFMEALEPIQNISVNSDGGAGDIYDDRLGMQLRNMKDKELQAVAKGAAHYLRNVDDAVVERIGVAVKEALQVRAQIAASTSATSPDQAMPAVLETLVAGKASTVKSIATEVDLLLRTARDMSAEGAAFFLSGLSREQLRELIRAASHVLDNSSQPAPNAGPRDVISGTRLARKDLEAIREGAGRQLAISVVLSSYLTSVDGLARMPPAQLQEMDWAVKWCRSQNIVTPHDTDSLNGKEILQVKATWENKVKGLESAITQFQARPTPNSSANPAQSSGL